MFLRVLYKQCQLFPQLRYVQVCCLRKYYDDGPDAKRKLGKTVKDVMDERAKEFMENLDVTHFKRKKYIERFIKQWRSESPYRMPNEISDRGWYELLHQSPSLRSYRKYLEILALKEREKQVKEEKQLERRRLLEENEAMYDHLYHLSDARDRQIYMWKKLSAMNSEIPVIIDLDFSELHQPGARKVADHIIRALKNNALHPQPLSFNITSCKNNLRLLDFQIAETTLPGGHFHEQHYLDLFPHEQLVYLSPEGPQLETFDTNSIYIVGGTHKTTTTEHCTFEMASEQGIRCASFPLFIHGRLKTPNASNALPIYTSLDIVRSMYYWHSWKSAFRECLSPLEYSLDDPFFIEDEPKRYKKSIWHKDS